MRRYSVAPKVVRKAKKAKKVGILTILHGQINYIPMWAYTVGIFSIYIFSLQYFRPVDTIEPKRRGGGKVDIRNPAVQQQFPDYIRIKVVDENNREIEKKK